MKKQLLGVNITISPKDEIVTSIRAYLRKTDADLAEKHSMKKAPFLVVTPNPEQIMYAEKHPDFAKLLNTADVALPDGIGIVWGMKRFFGISISRISGIDFMQDLVHEAHRNNWKIACFGGWGTVSAKALQELQNTYVGLNGWTETLPEFEIDASNQLITKSTGLPIETEFFEKLARRITDGETRLIFVGLGVPKQEIFMSLLKKQLMQQKSGPVVLMAVGGSFDMIAGFIPRAPSWIRAGGLEWLYRLVKEPWRWKRQLQLILFVLLVIRERFFHTKK